MQGADIYLCRAKAKENKEWAEGLLCPPTYPGHIGENWHIAVENTNLFGCECKVWIYEEIDIDTLCKASGRRDRNNTLIYTGDIVRTWYCESKRDKENKGAYKPREGLFEVVLHKLTCGLESVKTGSICFYVSTFESHELEIIGNIHDNPALLERSTT